MTNYEKIKAMSVEEMAMFLLQIYDYEDGLVSIDHTILVDHPVDVQEWLLQEAEQ